MILHIPDHHGLFIVNDDGFGHSPLRFIYSNGSYSAKRCYVMLDGLGGREVMNYTWIESARRREWAMPDCERENFESIDEYSICNECIMFIYPFLWAFAHTNRNRFSVTKKNPYILLWWLNAEQKRRTPDGEAGRQAGTREWKVLLLRPSEVKYMAPLGITALKFGLDLF